MTSRHGPLLKHGLLIAALGVALAGQNAFAVGTDAGTNVNNRATVSYTVGGLAQTPIESAPGGNSNPGAGNGVDTTFVVDYRVDFTVVEIGSSATVVTPGQLAAVTTFTVTNTGNRSSGYQLSAANLTGGVLFGNTDDADMTNLRTFVDANGNGTYDPGVDIATNVDTLAEDATITVFVVADAPATLLNGQFANVRLTARAAVPGTSGGTLEVATVGGDTTGVDVVFGDAGNDATEAADDQYAVQSAALSVAKVSAVISDPVNGTTTPKAIPGAVVEYTVTLTNTGTVGATGVAISDPLPTNAPFVTGGYTGTTDVQITVGAGAPTFCVAEAGGTDTNGDGCYRTATDLVVGAPAISTVATGGAVAAVAVRFRVTIP